MLTRSLRFALLAAWLAGPSLAQAQDQPNAFSRPPEPNYHQVNAKLADELEHHGRILRNLGAVILPVGVVASAVSFAVWFLALNSSCATGSACEQNNNDQIYGAIAGMVVGVATTVVGGLLLGRGMRAIREARALRMGLSPLVSSRTIGVGLRLEF